MKSLAKIGSRVKFNDVIVSGKLMLKGGTGEVIGQHFLPTKLGEPPEIVDSVHLDRGYNVEVFDRAVTLIKVGD